MEYIDSGCRKHNQTLAHWLEDVTQDGVRELRIQTGFFSANGLSPLLRTLKKCREYDKITRVLIGANESETTEADVSTLADYLDVSRPNAKLGIVTYSKGYFHPKTYHIVRKDGSQAALIGSANLTASGLSLHIEAGITLDTRERDPHALLDRIAKAIDEWFDNNRQGLNLITNDKSIKDLSSQGVLAENKPPRKASPSHHTKNAHPPLQPLAQLNPVPSPTKTPRIQPQPAAQASLSVPSNKFPQYLLFAPGNNPRTTTGANALTGSTLPSNAEGLIIEMNRDSVRHFKGQKGTANISLPIPTIATIRFGIYGKNNAPRAEFDLFFRYISSTITIDRKNGAPIVDQTAIQGYGFTKTASSHRDIRMNIPAKPNKELIHEISLQQLPLPKEGDLALLEWPTVNSPSFRITFLADDPASSTYQNANSVFKNATSTKATVGSGNACWLPAGLSPP